MSASVLGIVGYRILQQIVTRWISYNLRPGEVIVRLQTLDGRLVEDEFQFRTVPFQSLVKVDERVLLVRGVEVRR